MNRRAFLGVLALAAALAAGKMWRSEPEVSAIVRRNLPDMMIPDEVMRAFVRDYATATWIPGEGERRVMTAFVLWTSLSYDRHSKIRYIGPHVACGNPFARF